MMRIRIGLMSHSHIRTDANGPPISDMRAIRFLGPNAFDGELAKRLGANIIPGLGEWPSPENMSDNRGIILPSTVSQAQANVGDRLDSLTLPM